MLHFTQKQRTLPLLSLLLYSTAFFVWSAAAQTARASVQGGASASVQTPSETPAKDEDAPTYQEYKGVRIGMSADEARKRLGNPTDKGDQQDFYVLSESETAQVFYDAQKKVVAVATVYMGAQGGAPGPQAVVGEIEPRADGSLFKRVDYPKAGFWVSYSRTSGDSPVISITMQKRQ